MAGTDSGIDNAKLDVEPKPKEEIMTVERALRGIAGFFIIASVCLSYVHSPWWLLFTLFVGLNLLQSSFTNWCLMMNILKFFGMKSAENRTEEVQIGGVQ